MSTSHYVRRYAALLSLPTLGTSRCPTEDGRGHIEDRGRGFGAEKSSNLGNGGARFG
jgi:hypothetical protein